MTIDDAFIRKWGGKYDEIENDENEYQRLVDVVKQSGGAISRETLLRIWKWKGAMRVIRHVRLDEYESRYATAFCRAANAPVAQKLPSLLRGSDKLPGVGAPTGSTIIHFIDPETMPIIDVRTVETLHADGRLATKQRDLAHYEEFRDAIEDIKRACTTKWTLRQIDKALFAYHKLNGDDGKRLCPT